MRWAMRPVCHSRRSEVSVVITLTQGSPQPSMGRHARRIWQAHSSGIGAREGSFRRALVKRPNSLPCNERLQLEHQFPIDGCSSDQFIGNVSPLRRILPVRRCNLSDMRLCDVFQCHNPRSDPRWYNLACLTKRQCQWNRARRAPPNSRERVGRFYEPFIRSVA
jgi:hypothetical protein